MTRTLLPTAWKKATDKKNELVLGGRLRFSAAGKYAFLLPVGGVSYGLVELIWRGRTHPSMVLTGGLCLAAIYGINARLSGHSLVLRSAASAAAITGIELAVGVLVNRVWKMNVWDYSGMRFQLLGQISLVYSFYWFVLSGITLLLLDIYAKKRIKK